MEDAVAIEVTRADGSVAYCMTWGRVFNAVDPAPLLEALRPHLVKPGDEPTSIRVCDTLQEAAGAPYFFEAVIAFAQKSVPFGPDYNHWASEMRNAIIRGRELYRLG